MKQISSRDFQKSYAKLDEPSEVTAWGETIGVWIPRNSPIFDSLPLEEWNFEKEQPIPVVRTLPNGRHVTRQEVRVIDAVQIARQQEITRENWRLQPPRRQR